MINEKLTSIDLEFEKKYQKIRNSRLLINPLFIFKPKISIQNVDPKTLEYEAELVFECISCGEVCQCDIVNQIYTCPSCLYDMKFSEACHLLDKTREILYESRKQIEATFKIEDSVSQVEDKKKTWIRRTLRWICRIFSQR